MRSGEMALVGIAVLPVAAALVSYLFGSVWRRVVTLSAGTVTLLLAVVVASRVSGGGRISVGSFLSADSLSAIFLLVTAFLYAATALFSIGYLAGKGSGGIGGRKGSSGEGRGQKQGSSGKEKSGGSGGGNSGSYAERFDRRFFTGLNIFCGAMSIALVLSNIALIWVSIEVTTVVSALLVSLEDTDRSSEAAWKYILIASMGLGLSLIGVLVLYAAAAPVLGVSHALQIGYLEHAHGLPAETTELAFIFAVIGFGTKMGLAPMHTWLPDAHSEAPTPISALLSGSLLAVSFYAILRFEQVTIHNAGSAFPHDVLASFGVFSLLIAALFLLVQRDMKRMFAYSSVEHMGIIAIGASFGVPIALAGVMLHVVSHGLAKGTAFFGAGSFKTKFGTKDIGRITGGISALPWSGPLLLAAVAALSALPPFAIFRSEFMIVYGGMQSGGGIGVVMLLVLVTLAFAGLSWHTIKMVMSPGATAYVRGADSVAGIVDVESTVDPDSDSVAVASHLASPGKSGEPSIWMVIPMLVGIAGLLLLGIHPPAGFLHLMDSAARELSGGIS
jgi:hydrogenase-4 component F